MNILGVFIIEKKCKSGCEEKRGEVGVYPCLWFSWRLDSTRKRLFFATENTEENMKAKGKRQKLKGKNKIQKRRLGF